MGDLANMVASVAKNTASATQLKEARSALDEVRDLATSLAKAVADVESEIPLASALGVKNSPFATKVADVKRACISLMSALSAPGVGGVPKASAVSSVKDNLSLLTPEVRAASKAAWISYRDQHITQGAMSVLDAAERVGVKESAPVKTRLSVAQSLNQVPSVDALNNVYSAVAQYDQIRTQLAGGDAELERFVVDLTGVGVSLSDLQDYPDGQRWLKNYDLADRLRVVMRKD